MHMLELGSDLFIEFIITITRIALCNSTSLIPLIITSGNKFFLETNECSFIKSHYCLIINY